MRRYLVDLIERMSDRTPVTSSVESVAFVAHREAERLTDRSMVEELAAGVHRLKSDERRSCYFAIGKIGLNLGDDRCAQVLLDLLPAETSKYMLAAILDALSAIPKGPQLDLAPVFPHLEDARWLVRHSAIGALDNSASPDAEAHVIAHLASTTDPYDITYCNAVLNHIGTLRAVSAIEANLSSRKRDVKLTARRAVEAIRNRAK